MSTPPAKPTPGMRLVALAARGALGLLRALGPVRASNLAGAIARGIGPRLPASRVAERNLRMAMPHLDATGRQRVIRAVWDNLGRTVGELPHLATLQQDTPHGPGWEITGAEHLAAQRALGGPVVFVSGHIGNWEMLPPAVARHGLPFASFYRAADNPLVDAMIRRLRRDAMGTDTPMFPKGARGARDAIAHIARGGHLGGLVDQKMNDGVEARFFGMPAMTAPALAAIALRYGCPVIPGYVERLGPARLRIVVEPALTIRHTGNRHDDQMLLIQAINDRLQHWIESHPGSWLWLHRRWPRQLYKK